MILLDQPYLVVVTLMEYRIPNSEDLKDKSTSQTGTRPHPRGMVQFPTDELTILDLDIQNFTFPTSPDRLSDILRETMINWIKNR